MYIIVKEYLFIRFEIIVISFDIFFFHTVFFVWVHKYMNASIISKLQICIDIELPFYYHHYA